MTAVSQPSPAGIRAEISRYQTFGLLKHIGTHSAAVPICDGPYVSEAITEHYPVTAGYHTILAIISEQVIEVLV
jgi:hypothetical protein